MLVRPDGLLAPLTVADYETLVTMHDREWTGPHTALVRRFGRASQTGYSVCCQRRQMDRLSRMGLLEPNDRGLYRMTDAGYRAWWDGPTDRRVGIVAKSAQPVW